MKIVGLNLTSRAVPGVLWKDTTGPTGVITLTRGAAFTNATAFTLYVWAIARSPSSRDVVEQRNWVLEPGRVGISLPDPAPGTYWTLYTQTAFQHNYGAAADWGGLVVLGGLAAYGTYTLVTRYRRKARRA